MLRRIDHGKVLELQLDRPPANALNPALIEELGREVALAAGEGERALVLSGREGMFSAGLDVPEFLQLDRKGVRAAWTAFFDLMRALASSPIPVACAITGHSPAGGCVLALFCDKRIMAEGDYKIGLNEVQVGLRMPRPIHAAATYVLGQRQAERICTTAELVRAAEAHRIGLVDELVPMGEVIPRAIAWGQRMTQLPPQALRKTRAIAREGLIRPFDALDEESLELFLDEWFGAETQGAMRAMIERIKKS